MPQDNFYDLGKEPSKMNDVGRSDKVRYPCLYDVTPENFPPLKDMKLGDTGEALMRFKIATSGGGIEVQEIKWIGSADPKAEADKKKLLDRRKKDQFKKSDEPTADADSGGGYQGGF